MQIVSRRAASVVAAICCYTTLAAAPVRAEPEPVGHTAVEAPSVPLGVVKLGMTQAELEDLCGEGLRKIELKPRRSLASEILELSPRKGPAQPIRDPQQHPGQQRFGRKVPGRDVVEAEYDLHAGHVYRLRWRLAPHFERAVMEPLVAHLRERLGEPAYDQTLKAKLGSRTSDRRRAGWDLAGRSLELRQLHPFMGGPLYLTFSDVARMQAIVSAGGVVLPQPDHDQQWWQGSRGASGGSKRSLPTTAERRALIESLDALLELLDLPIEPDSAEPGP